MATTTSPCPCCSPQPCFCCDPTLSATTLSASVTLLSGSSPWDITGDYTLAEIVDGCSWGISVPFGSPSLDCAIAIFLACNVSSGPAVGCSGYGLIVGVGSGVLLETCFGNSDYAAVFGACECSPISLTFRFTITVTTTESCCGVAAGTYSAQYEVTITP